MSLEIRKLSVPLEDCHLVKDASLSLAPGQLVGLIGANGAGKSTLLRAIAGLIPTMEGDVEIDGVPAKQMTGRQRAHRLSFLPQSQSIDWAICVRDVVGLGRFPFQGRFGQHTEEDDEIITETVTRLGLTSIADRDAQTLSGGERALTLLARALCVGAPYLLADEPTAALDPARQLEVMDVLRAEAVKGRGVLVVLHDLTLASRFLDHVVVMHRGEILAEGPPKDVLSEAVLETAYGISPLTGTAEGENWLLPWKRTNIPAP